MRRNDSSTASSASAGVEELRHLRLRQEARHYDPRFLDERDLAARLQDGPLDLRERRDALRPRLFEYLVLRQPLALEVVADPTAVLHEHDRLAVEHDARLLRAAEPEVRDPGLQHRDRAAGEHQADDGVVALRHALLDQVAEHDEQDHVERLERRQLATPHDAREQQTKKYARDARRTMSI
jgi:hypothetical protein